MAAVGRFLLILAVVGAPWAFGGVRPWPQFVLAAIVGGLTVLRLVEASVRRADLAVHIPLAGIAPLALLLIAAVQLLPREAPPSAKMKHAVFAETAIEFTGPDHVATGTLSAASTRRESARLYFAMAAFLLAAQWFADPQTHRYLYTALAANGAALGAFGIVQSLSWNGMLFWSVPLRFGGTPFASYVNRNNAAGYLNLALAAAIGLGVFLLGRRTVSGDRSGIPSRSVLRTRDRIRYSIARIDGRHVAIMGLMTVCTVSLLFSMSRGGILAMVAAVVVVAAASRRGISWKSLGGACLIVVMVGGLVEFAGRSESIDARLETLADPAAAAAGRFEHWQDTFGAVRDFPLLGSGFGTYRFANQPYQAHPAHAWYYNADNEWFEILVEMGGLGLGATIVGLLLIAISALSLLRQDEPQWRAAGVVGLFVVVSQAVQGVTDFGLILPANGLTFAVLGGAVCGAACREADFRQIRVPLSLSLARLEGRPSQALFGFVLAVSSAAFLLELLTATYASAARDVSEKVDPDRTRIAAIDASIAFATNALRFRPDDAELHQVIGDLWISRFELQMYRRLKEDVPFDSRPPPATLWRIARLPVLAIQVRQLESEGRLDEASQIRSLLAVTDNLPQAQHHLEEALRHCSLTRGAALTLARLATFRSPVTSSRSVSDLRKSQFTSPSTVSALLATAGLAWASGEVRLADRCWQRVLVVAPEEGPTVWVSATQGRSAEEVVRSVVPQSVEALVTIAESIADAPTREMLVRRAATVLEDEDDGVSSLVRARLADLQSQAERAIHYYRLALADDPWDIEARLRFARLLRTAGRLTEADVEYSLLSQQAPTRKDIQAEKTELLRELLELRVSTTRTNDE